jgi:hypothetical protein
MTASDRWKVRITAIVCFSLSLFALFVCTLFVQGLIIMRDEVMDDPLTWAPNFIGAIAMMGFVVGGFAGFITCWNAPTTSGPLQPPPLAKALFQSNKYIVRLGLLLIVLMYVVKFR